MALHNNVFNQQIWEWFCNDMDSCILVSTDLQKKGIKSKFSGGINFPAALACFSVIELMASYYAGKKKAGNEDIAEFISKYIGRYYPKLKSKTIAKKWYEVFRNGLSHQWAPKFGGVSMDTGSQEIFVFLIPTEGREEIPYLVVPKLFYVMCDALKDFEHDLDTDEKLRKKFEKRYENIMREDKKVMGLFRDMCNEK